MTTQSDDLGVDQINQAVLKRFAKSSMSIQHFQSALGLTENDGFVNREGATEPEFADNIAQLIKDGRIQEAQDLLAQMTGPKVRHSTAERATVNPYGATRTPVAVVGGQRGARATWVGAQSFDSVVSLK